MVGRITDIAAGYDELTHAPQMSANFKANIAGGASALSLELIANQEPVWAGVTGVVALLTSLSSFSAYRKIWNSAKSQVFNLSAMGVYAMLSGGLVTDAIYRTFSGSNTKLAAGEVILAIFLMYKTNKYNKESH